MRTACQKKYAVGTMALSTHVVKSGSSHVKLFHLVKECLLRSSMSVPLTSIPSWRLSRFETVRSPGHESICDTTHGLSNAGHTLCVLCATESDELNSSRQA